jgi:hypothetical protein
MKKIILVILLAVSTAMAANATKEITIKKVTPPVIDGVDTDGCWDAVDLNIVNLKTLSNPLDASFKMCYDDNNIYVMVYVTDPTPFQIGSATVLNFSFRWILPFLLHTVPVTSKSERFQHYHLKRGVLMVYQQVTLN